MGDRISLQMNHTDLTTRAGRSSCFKSPTSTFTKTITAAKLESVDGEEAGEAEEEEFFDSQTWLHSDGEDLYDGDKTTPHLSCTPIHLLNHGAQRTLSELFLENDGEESLMARNEPLVTTGLNVKSMEAAAALQQRRKSGSTVAHRCLHGFIRSLSCRKKLSHSGDGP
ncbi:hypothetical protein Dimus_015247 [Dionaea muscipula]